MFWCVCLFLCHMMSVSASLLCPSCSQYWCWWPWQWGKYSNTLCICNAGHLTVGTAVSTHKRVQKHVLCTCCYIYYCMHWYGSLCSATIVYMAIVCRWTCVCVCVCVCLYVCVCVCVCVCGWVWCERETWLYIHVHVHENIREPQLPRLRTAFKA